MRHNNQTTSSHFDDSRSNNILNLPDTSRICTAGPTQRARDSTMGQNTMLVLHFPTHRTTTSRTRSTIASILILLCVPMFFYHLVPSFTHATDEFITIITSTMRGQSSQCTREIGSTYCCTLFMESAPCVDECRREHVDRVTWILTEEYDECANTCLVRYEESCGSEG
jgi:hypothetical protein